MSKNTTPPRPGTPSFDELRPLIEANPSLKLIPLHGPGPLCEMPIHDDWFSRDYEDFDAEVHMRAGGNAGIRLDRLVVMVTPNDDGRTFAYRRPPSGADPSVLAVEFEDHCSPSGPECYTLAPGSVTLEGDMMPGSPSPGKVTEAPQKLIDALTQAHPDMLRAYLDTGVPLVPPPGPEDGSVDAKWFLRDAHMLRAGEEEEEEEEEGEPVRASLDGLLMVTAGALSLHQLERLRAKGLLPDGTLRLTDAGGNVYVITGIPAGVELAQRLEEFPGVQFFSGPRVHVHVPGRAVTFMDSMRGRGRGVH